MVTFSAKTFQIKIMHLNRELLQVTWPSTTLIRNRRSWLSCSASVGITGIHCGILLVVIIVLGDADRGRTREQVGVLGEATVEITIGGADCWCWCRGMDRVWNPFNSGILLISYVIPGFLLNADVTTAASTWSFGRKVLSNLSVVTFLQ